MEQPTQVGKLIRRKQQKPGATANSPCTSPAKSAAAACIERYGTRFVETFAPRRQAAYCADVDRLFTGTAPTLAIVAQAYGRQVAESWIELQLQDLSEFSGCRVKLTPEQMDQVAAIVANLYPWLKVTELMYFFFLFKSGRFGRFYGAVDAMIITVALRDFVALRAEELGRIERTVQQRRALEAKKEKCISREEWERLKNERRKKSEI